MPFASIPEALEEIRAGRTLVVDDNRVNRLLLTHALEQNGHHVSTAENGQIGMDMLRSQPLRCAPA